MLIWIHIVKPRPICENHGKIDFSYKKNSIGLLIRDRPNLALMPTLRLQHWCIRLFGSIVVKPRISLS